jgi:hypothetical protein
MWEGHASRLLNVTVSTFSEPAEYFRRGELGGTPIKLVFDEREAYFQVEGGAPVAATVIEALLLTDEIGGEPVRFDEVVYGGNRYIVSGFTKAGGGYTLTLEAAE